MTHAMSTRCRVVFQNIAARGPIPKRVIVANIITAGLHHAEHRRRKKAGVLGSPSQAAEDLVDRVLQRLRRDGHIKLVKGGWVITRLKLAKSGCGWMFS